MTKEEALHRAAVLCSMAEKCEMDVRNKLVAWGIESKEVDDIVKHLKHEGYVDEERFCRAYVNDKLRFAGWGRVKIGYALRQKGVKGDLIDEMLSKMDEVWYREVLKDVLKGKLRSVNGGDRSTQLGKLVRFAQGRGFELSLALEVANKLLK